MFTKDIDLGRTEPFTLKAGIYQIIVEAEFFGREETQAYLGSFYELKLTAYRLATLGWVEVMSRWDNTMPLALSYDIYFQEVIARWNTQYKSVVGRVTGVQIGDRIMIYTNPRATRHIEKARLGIVTEITVPGFRMDMTPGKEGDLRLAFMQNTGISTPDVVGEVTAELYTKLSSIQAEVDEKQTQLVHGQKLRIRKKTEIAPEKWATAFLRNYQVVGPIMIKQVA